MRTRSQQPERRTTIPRRARTQERSSYAVLPPGDIAASVPRIPSDLKRGGGLAGSKRGAKSDRVCNCDEASRCPQLADPRCETAARAADALSRETSTHIEQRQSCGAGRAAVPRAISRRRRRRSEIARNAGLTRSRRCSAATPAADRGDQAEESRRTG